MITGISNLRDERGGIGGRGGFLRIAPPRLRLEQSSNMPRKFRWQYCGNFGQGTKEIVAVGVLHNWMESFVNNVLKLGCLKKLDFELLLDLIGLISRWILV